MVFAGEVGKRVSADPRVRDLEAKLGGASGVDRSALAAELADTRQTVRAEKIGEVAAEFDAVHSIQRAVEVGSVDAVIKAAELRPRIIGAIENSAAWSDRGSRVTSS